MKTLLVLFMLCLVPCSATVCTFVNGTDQPISLGEGNNDPLYLNIVLPPRSNATVDWPLETRSSIDIFAYLYTSGYTVDNVFTSSTPPGPGQKMYVQFMNVGGAYNIGYIYDGSGASGASIPWADLIEYFLYGFGLVTTLELGAMMRRLAGKMSSQGGGEV